MYRLTVESFLNLMGAPLLAARVAMKISCTNRGSVRETAVQRVVWLLIAGICLIAFATWAQEQPDIYLVNMDGTGLKQLTNDALSESRPSWSPDAKFLAYSAFNNAASSSTIYIHDLATGERRPLLEDGGDDWDPAWSPDGSTIVFASNREGRLKLFACTPEGEKLRCLTRDFAPDSYHFSPVWAPSGEKLVLSVRPQLSGPVSLYILDSLNETPRRLSKPDSEYMMPNWSPDGRQILCGRLRVDGPVFEEADCWEHALINVDTGEYRVLDLYDPNRPERRNDCAFTCSMATLLPGGNEYLVTKCAPFYLSRPLLFKIEEGGAGELFLSDPEAAAQVPPLYGLVLAPEGSKAACNGVDTSYPTVASQEAVRIEVRAELKKYGRPIGWLLLGPHGELVVPNRNMLFSPNFLLVNRQGDELVVRFSGYGEEGEFLKVKADGKIEKLQTARLLRSESRLPEEWPFKSGLEGLLPPEEGRVLHKSTAAQPVNACPHWLIPLANGVMYVPPANFERSPNVICIERVASGLELTYEGPDWEGTFATVGPDRKVIFSEENGTPKRGTVYWPFVDEAGQLGLPNMPGLSISFASDEAAVQRVNADGTISVRVGP